MKNGREREREGERVKPRLPEIGVVGISHHTAPLEVRERCVIEGEELARVAEMLRAEGAGAVVVLSTCNRTELYVEAGDSGSLAGAEALLRGRAGLDAGSQQGAIYIYLVLIATYVWLMNRLDRSMQVDEERTGAEA